VAYFLWGHSVCVNSVDTSHSMFVGSDICTLLRSQQGSKRLGAYEGSLSGCWSERAFHDTSKAAAPAKAAAAAAAVNLGNAVLMQQNSVLWVGRPATYGDLWTSEEGRRPFAPVGRAHLLRLIVDQCRRELLMLHLDKRRRSRRVFIRNLSCLFDSFSAHETCSQHSASASHLCISST